MLGLAIIQLLVGGAVDVDVDTTPAPADAGFHRGTGWYAPGSVPEPPYALGLVIVAAAGMRRYERRRACRSAVV